MKANEGTLSNGHVVRDDNSGLMGLLLNRLPDGTGRPSENAAPGAQDQATERAYEAPDLLPPYASYSSWVRLLDGLVGSLPSALDETYFASQGFSPYSIKPLRSALRFLDLVERDDRPTKRLELLVEALREGGTTRMEAVREMVSQSYRPFFSTEYDLKSVSVDELRSYFGTMGAQGQIQQKCCSFFLNLTRDAGLELPPQLICRAPLALGRQRSHSRAFKAIDPLQHLAPKRPKSAVTVLKDANLLRDVFPMFDIDWPEAKKQRWFKDFARLIAICDRDSKYLAG